LPLAGLSSKGFDESADASQLKPALGQLEPLGPVRQADRSGSLDSPDSPAKMGRGIQRRTANLRTSSQGEYRCCPSSSWLSSWLARASLIHRRRRRSAPLDRGQRPEYVSLNTFQVARQDGGSPVWWTFRVPASLLLEQHRCASNGHAYTIREEFLVGFVVGKSRSDATQRELSSARSKEYDVPEREHFRVSVQREA
jgi:hypothetical protein